VGVLTYVFGLPATTCVNHRNATASINSALKTTFQEVLFVRMEAPGTASISILRPENNLSGVLNNRCAAKKYTVD
jgi:hypothetical protein